jgi:hypothetical protein
MVWNCASATGLATWTSWSLAFATTHFVENPLTILTMIVNPHNRYRKDVVRPPKHTLPWKSFQKCFDRKSFEIQAISTTLHCITTYACESQLGKMSKEQNSTPMTVEAADTGKVSNFQIFSRDRDEVWETLDTFTTLESKVRRLKALRGPPGYGQTELDDISWQRLRHETWADPGASRSSANFLPRNFRE